MGVTVRRGRAQRGPPGWLQTPSRRGWVCLSLETWPCRAGRERGRDVGWTTGAVATPGARCGWGARGVCVHAPSMLRERHADTLFPGARGACAHSVLEVTVAPACCALRQSLCVLYPHLHHYRAAAPTPSWSRPVGWGRWQRPDVLVPVPGGSATLHGSRAGLLSRPRGAVGNL